MFSFADLQIPIVAAPMAGYSTPALVDAVNSTGALGFLAAGNKTADAVAHELDQVDTSKPFGVNVFVPDTMPLSGDDLAQFATYREVLAPIAERFGAEIPEPTQDSDGWEEKLDLLVGARVSLVSFTFGLPGAEEVNALHDVGTSVVVTVTSPDDARRATAIGADALIVQGPEAGGHRSTLATEDEPDTRPLPELLAAVRAQTSVPLVASGGLTSGRAVREMLDAGSVAAQVGTGFLLADEASTSEAHRMALRDSAFTETRASRAYTGRPARSLVNEYMEKFEPLAPGVYPALQRMTAPARKAAAAAGESQLFHLWAGVNWREAPDGPAADIVRDLWAAARASESGADQ